MTGLSISFFYLVKKPSDFATIIFSSTNRHRRFWFLEGAFMKHRKVLGSGTLVYYSFNPNSIFHQLHNLLQEVDFIYSFKRSKVLKKQWVRILPLITSRRLTICCLLNFLNAQFCAKCKTLLFQYHKVTYLGLTSTISNCFTNWQIIYYD